MRIGEATFGPDHPNVAIGLNNLAGLLKETNRLGEAEPLYRRALAIDEATLGPEHPGVARDLNLWLKKFGAPSPESRPRRGRRVGSASLPERVRRL